MLKEKMYVRCPADLESPQNPRVFVCGQIMAIDTFAKTVTVDIHDPFYCISFFEDLPKGRKTFPINVVDHCSLFDGTDVVYHAETFRIVSNYYNKEDGYYYYYLSKIGIDTPIVVCETDLVAAFNNGHIDPSTQLKRYEFQNPCWFMGRAVVSRSMTVLNNTMYGFKELAGSKIYLLPHQVNTIMRCLQTEPCRYMLADEVGMGKTIEAISVLKIYLSNKSNRHALIIVPEALKAQWTSELLLKFNIEIGLNRNHNMVSIMSAKELKALDLEQPMDFVIIDEVHRYLKDEDLYSLFHMMSVRAENLLLLSATPVQKRKAEYLSLLRLLQPDKYDEYSQEDFDYLVEKQSKIVQKTALVLDTLEEYQELINELQDDEEDPHDSDECEELFDEITEDLKQICLELNDGNLNSLIDQVSFDASDFATYQIRLIVSYICGHYQIESHIVRNRRKVLEKNGDGEQLMPVRQMELHKYRIDEGSDENESRCYQLLTEWVRNNISSMDVETVIRPLLEAYFSSSWAFLDYLEANSEFSSSDLLFYAKQWVRHEDDIVEHAVEALEDPGAYESDYSTRVMTILNLLYDELDDKVVIFTNNEVTFEKYRELLEKVFDPEETSFFGASMDSEELEVNAYKFQNNQICRIMLCDHTGGEGRNFQCADYVLHVDLPWDANIIEQRIGRLDRLERSPDRPIVHSVVVLAEETFEEALFEFWNKGLSIFTQSLSGMEIIMQEINEQIFSAVKEDFKYGLFSRVSDIIDLALTMKEQVRKEQNYDAAGFIFRPMFTELKKLINYYSLNDNELFAETMTNWANLAGFHGYSDDEDGVVVYRASSFSSRSAVNSQLIPPQWNEYINSRQNEFVNSVRNAYCKKRNHQEDSQSIHGTFIRNKAIENDYLHFFAPGDEVFDCIVDNAMHSMKGCSSAFAVETDIEWRGLVYIWSLAPNENVLFENNMSIYSLSPYRSFLSSRQLLVPESVFNPDEVSDDQVCRAFNRAINKGYSRTGVVHLGKRTEEPLFLRKEIRNNVNINWFKERFPKEKWVEFVTASRNDAYKKALLRFKDSSNVKGAREEMERALSSREANNLYFGLNEDIDRMKREQAVVLEALRRPRIMLDSVAFVWMVKNIAKN